MELEHVEETMVEVYVGKLETMLELADAAASKHARMDAFIVSWVCAI